MNVLRSILDALFPDDLTCDLCGREVFGGACLCKKCEATVTFNDQYTCPVCGRKTASDQLCLECKEQPPMFDTAASALVYEGGGRNLVLAFKNDKAYLKNYLAQLMSEKCAQFSDAEAICFVPMTDGARRRRGYNQAQLLAKELAKILRLPLLKKAVVKIKKTGEQKSLTRKERAQNLKSAFRADPQAVNGKNLIVVDDVLTTGATADAVCAELKKRGAAKIYFATVASVEYKALSEEE